MYRQSFLYRFVVPILVLRLTPAISLKFVYFRFFSLQLVAFSFHECWHHHMCWFHFTFCLFFSFFWLKQNGNRTQIRNSRMRGQSRCRKNCLYRMRSQSTVLVRLQIEMLQWSFASFWYLLYAVCSIFNSLRLK